MSLIVVITAPPARLLGIPFSQVIPHWTIAVNLLAGSLIGCLAGCELGDPDALDDPVSGPRGALLVLIAGTLVATHLGHTGSMNLSAPLRITAGVTAGVLIGIVAALMGVAGGELLIPTIVLLFAVDIKIAGSLSLAVSLPTMLVAFAPLQPRPELRRAAAQHPLPGHHGRPDRSPERSSADCSWAASRPWSSSRSWPGCSSSPRSAYGGTPRPAPRTHRDHPPQPTRVGPNNSVTAGPIYLDTARRRVASSATRPGSSIPAARANLVTLLVISGSLSIPALGSLFVRGAGASTQVDREGSCTPAGTPEPKPCHRSVRPPHYW